MTSPIQQNSSGPTTGLSARMHRINRFHRLRRAGFQAQDVLDKEAAEKAGEVKKFSSHISTILSERQQQVENVVTELMQMVTQSHPLDAANFQVNNLKETLKKELELQTKLKHNLAQGNKHLAQQNKQCSELSQQLDALKMATKNSSTLDPYQRELQKLGTAICIKAASK